MLDAQDEEALCKSYYRDALPVAVFSITASEKWTSTDFMLAEIGGLMTISGFDELDYKPQWKSCKP